MHRKWPRFRSLQGQSPSKICWISSCLWAAVIELVTLIISLNLTHSDGISAVWRCYVTYYEEVLLGHLRPAEFHMVSYRKIKWHLSLWASFTMVSGGDKGADWGGSSAAQFPVRLTWDGLPSPSGLRCSLHSIPLIFIASSYLSERSVGLFF